MRQQLVIRGNFMLARTAPGEPEEQPCLTVFLASPVAGHISGIAFPVDGDTRRHTF